MEYLLSAIGIPIVVLSVLGNLLTIAAVFKSRTLRYHNAVLLTTSLAFCDLSFSVLCCPVNFITTLTAKKELNTTLCRINGFLGVLFCLTSLLTLSIVSFDRYIAIVTPFRYRVWMTYKRIKIVIAFKWIFAAVIASVPLSGWGNYIFYPQKGFCFIDYNKDVGALYFMGVWFNVGLGLISFSYYHIFKEARRQNKQIKSLSVGDKLEEKEFNPEHNLHHQRNLLSRIKREHKAAFIIFVIIGSFVICWLPFVVVNFISGLMKCDINQHADVFSMLLVAVSSCVNPFFYGWLDPSFRPAFKRILLSIRRRLRLTLTTSNSIFAVSQ